MSNFYINETKLKRNIYQSSFEEFVKAFWYEVPGAGPLKWNWHMSYLCQQLQEVAERVFRNEPKLYDLICNISPGTSKSTIFSVMFQPWCWTRSGIIRHITGSNTESLAHDLSSKSRELLRSKKYQEYFPEITVSASQDNKGHYRLDSGGDRFVCTVGGRSPMGFHAHFITIDDPIDPIKGTSEVELSTASNFFRTVIPSRKIDKDVSVTILVMQRICPGDPTDVMLEIAKQEGSGKVKLICLPAELSDNINPPELAEKYVNGLMDPNRLNEKVLLEAKNQLGLFAYNGQYGQRPIIQGGGLFKDYYFNQRVAAAPYNSKRIRFWDRACLVGTTLITTERGQVPISEVTTDDKVLTRKGYKKVLKSWLTKYTDEITIVELSNGSTLSGTQDHLVWTENDRWVYMEDLSWYDKLLTPTGEFVHPIRCRTYQSRCIKGEAVYDLTVEDCPEFYANGVLVHNSTQNGGCATAGVLLAKDDKGNYYVEHVVHGHWEPTIRNATMLATARRDRLKYGVHEPIIYVEQERGSCGADAWKALVKDLEGFYVKSDLPTGSKETRAEPWSSMLAAKNVWIVEDSTWDIKGYIDEHVAFPHGKLLDRVDASSGAFNLLLNSRSMPLMKSYSISNKKNKDKLRIIYTTEEKLLNYSTVIPAVVLRIADPGIVMETVEYPNIQNLLGIYDRYFTTIDPKDYQDKWEINIEPYNQVVKDLILTPESSKTIWKDLVRLSNPPPKIIFVVDPDESRGLSVAMALSDGCGLPRSCVYKNEDDNSSMETTDKAPNEYIYSTLKKARSSVV